MSAPSSAGGVGPGRDGAAGLTRGDAADCAADGTGVGIAGWAGGCAVAVTDEGRGLDRSPECDERPTSREQRS